jgi:phosphoribosyl 1,2-cyclic phosphodiesterase
MRITFWGVRGSIPSPGPDTVGVGGNTSCVEVRAGKAFLVFDGGTGLRLLGKRALGEMPFTAHIFFSHVHWDHIQGFPFFDPAFVPGNVIHLYGGNNVSRTLEETLAGQMDHPSFPVHLTDMGATMHFHGIDGRNPVEVDAGDGTKALISAAPGNHPNGVWAYRVDHGGHSVVYATDTEHYAVVDPKLAKLAKGADVLIYDSQYFPEEYSGTGGGMPKLGWGHSTYEEAVKLAQAAGVKKLVLYHHDPTQNDGAVAEKERRARTLFASCEAAREGLVLEL